MKKKFTDTEAFIAMKFTGLAIVLISAFTIVLFLVVRYVAYWADPGEGFLMFLISITGVAVWIFGAMSVAVVVSFYEDRECLGREEWS